MTTADTTAITADNSILTADIGANNLTTITATLYAIFARRLEKDSKTSTDNGGDQLSGTVTGTLPARLQRVEDRKID